MDRGPNKERMQIGRKGGGSGKCETELKAKGPQSLDHELVLLGTRPHSRRWAVD